MDVGLSSGSARSARREPGTVVGQGGGGPGWCATRGQADMRGLVTAGPGFVVRARVLGSSVAPVGFAHSVIAGALARGGQVLPAASLTDVVQGRSVGVRDRPAEPGEFACDSDRDDRASLAAFCVEAAPGAVQALLGLPGERDDVRVLAGLAALECESLRGRCGGSARRPRPAAGGRDGSPVLVIEP